MEALAIRTTPAQLSALLVTSSRPPLRAVQCALSRNSRIPNLNRQHISLFPQYRRTLSTSSRDSQQAAARRRDPEPEDENEEDIDESQRRQQPQAQEPPPPLPTEPKSRLTLSGQYLNDPANRPKRKKPDPLGFLLKAKVNRGEDGPLGPQPRRPQNQGETQPQTIQTDRSSAYDFLEQNKDNSSLDFLREPRRQQAQAESQQNQDTTNPALPRFASMSASGTDVGTSTDATSKSSLADLLASYRTGGINLDFLGPTRRPPGGTGSGAGTVPTHRMQMPTNVDPLALNRPTAYATPTVPSRVSTYLGGLMDSKNEDLAPPTFRMSPSLGRTQIIDAERGIDVARAFRVVDIKCATNAVRTDSGAQRFHERPGIKRKRLRMVRWRRRFMEGFRKTVRRVEDMRRKGW